MDRAKPRSDPLVGQARGKRLVGGTQATANRLRIPTYSYTRRSSSTVLVVVAVVQALVTATILWPRKSVKSNVLYIGLAAVAAVGFALVVTGVLACANGNSI